MDATCSSKTLVDFEGTTSRYIPKDRTLHNHRCEQTILNGIFFRKSFLSRAVKDDHTRNAVIRAYAFIIFFVLVSILIGDFEI
jgi:hypothetical protein